MVVAKIRSSNQLSAYMIKNFIRDQTTSVGQYKFFELFEGFQLCSPLFRINQADCSIYYITDIADHIFSLVSINIDGCSYVGVS